MSQYRDQIQGDLRTAMKARDKEATSTLRLLLTAIKNEEIQQGEPLDEAAFVAVVRRGIKQRQEAASQYRNGGREEAAAKEESEAAFLEQYLPTQLTDDEIREIVTELIEREGFEGMSAIGQLMKSIMADYVGRVDGKTVQRIAREALS